MSFSFNLTANTREEARDRVTRLLDETLEYQPHHWKDGGIAVKTAHEYINLIEEDPKLLINVEVYGSIGYPYDAKPEEDFPVTAVQVGVRVWQTPRVDTAEQ
jgi:hypothetical protein